MQFLRWCLYKKRKFGCKRATRDAHRKEHVRTQQNVICKSRREASEETKSVDTLILDFQSSELKDVFIGLATVCDIFVLATLAN